MRLSDRGVAVAAKRAPWLMRGAIRLFPAVSPKATAKPSPGQ
jgi:hypothetical protein